MGALRNSGIETVARHFVQILPVILAAIVLYYRAGWIPSIGGPLLLAWLAGMFTLWNFWRRVPEKSSDFIFPIEEAVFSGIIVLSAVLGLLFMARITSELRFVERLG